MQQYIIILLCAFFLSSFSQMPVGVIEVKINNINEHYGTLWLGVYRSEASFLNKEEAILYSVQNLSDNEESVIINNLDYGDYAIALFHDLNNNGVMDFDWMGIPAEPYAFSKPLRSKWRVPAFKEVKISLHESQKTVSTRLMTWWSQ